MSDPNATTTGNASNYGDNSAPPQGSQDNYDLNQQPTDATAGADDSSVPPPVGADDLPPQHHAGKVGYGPGYGQGAVCTDSPHEMFALRI